MRGSSYSESQQKVCFLRRMSLLHTDGATRRNLLTIIEQIEPDMPDYDFSPKEEVQGREGAFSIEIEDYDFGEHWMDDPNTWIGRIGCEYVNQKRIPEDKHHLVLAREFDETKITDILPFRKGPYYVAAYTLKNKQDRLHLEDESLRQQLSSLSEKRLGFDICMYEEWLGGIFMVWHHPIIKDIHFTATDSPAGMLCTMIARKPVNMKLTFSITDHDEEGNQIREPVDVETDMADGKCLLRTKQPVTRPDVVVRDETGEDVFAIRKIIFIKKIVLNMGVMDSVTGMKETAMEKDVIAQSSSKKAAERGQERNEIAQKIASLLRGLPQEEQELVLEDVNRIVRG